MHVLKTLNREPDNDQNQQDEQLDPGKIASFGKLYSAILLSPGDVVSLPKLTAKGLFRPTVNGISGRQLMLKVTIMHTYIIATGSKQSNFHKLKQYFCCHSYAKNTNRKDSLKVDWDFITTFHQP